MKSIIPYQKEISFGFKIAEITSMSLEHEIEMKPEEVSGNFILSGEYKSHEVSVNREPFLYKLPFSIELTDQIDLDSLQFEITDFSYDLLNDDTIEVNIEFSIEAEELPHEETKIVEEPQVEDIEERNIHTSVEDPIVEPDLTQFMDSVVVESPTVEEVEKLEPGLKSEEMEFDLPKKDEVMMTEQKEILEKENMQMSEETIIKNVNPADDSFATYHIHIVKEGENVETICTMYHSNLNLLSDYNDMSNVMTGDKIIIPKEDE